MVLGHKTPFTEGVPPVRPLAEGCRNIGTWPVLVGELGERHTMLSAPVFLCDHPRLSHLV